MAIRFSLLLTAISLVSATAAYAQDNGAYLRLDSGYSFSRNAGGDVGSSDVGSTPIIGAGIGYHITDYLRSDLTLGYRGWYQARGTTPVIPGQTLTEKADINSTSGMASLYYDVGHFGIFTPYLGGGIGLAYNKVDTTKLSLNGASFATIDSGNRTTFAWQAGAGTAVRLTQGLSLDVGYRYANLGQIRTGTTADVSGTPTTVSPIKARLKASEAQLGLRYDF